LTLPYDPANGDAFWSDIRRIPGCPEIGQERLVGEMIFESGALFKLPDVLRRAGADPKRRLLVVMDPTPMRRGNDDLKPLVLRVLKDASWKPEKLELKSAWGEQVHADLNQVSAVEVCLNSETDVVSIGSGTVTDVTKQACFNFEEKTGIRPVYVAFPTANSVGAFISNVASILIRGVKRSIPSRLPDALVYDLETLRDAPYAMTVAGVGDMLVGFVSLPDWLIANRLGMDPTYTEFPRILVGQPDKIFLENASRIRKGSLEGVAVLAKFLAAAVLGMSMLHVSTPLSGYEHIISHMIDQQAEAEGIPVGIHGTQVILAAMVVGEAYRNFINEFDPEQVKIENCYPEKSVMKQRIEKTFALLDPSGGAAAECWSEYSIKLESWYENRPAFKEFLEGWGEIRKDIEIYLVPVERIARILTDLGSPRRFDELDTPVDESKVKFAFMNAPFIRSRVTFGDLLIFLNWDREALWQKAWAGMIAASGN
jgi:glycerol-1-phosphate dehydrogenase [NAD(P)+]